ncbi:Bifunctional nuclease domain containing protein [Parasponia andersonii]|uniref:Bifunctional nuclease domain containing protein n=1 Tax=Parasponia andersonii TaxID=3476 RepID=A0A2P5BMD4_PARAD|nr:Bifunctional nuclease domain containing protein [Parasponia andersonii]
MLGAQLCVRTATGIGIISDHYHHQANTSRPIRSSSSSSSCSFQLGLRSGPKRCCYRRCCRPNPVFICCNSSSSSSSGSRSSNGDDRDHEDYLEASLLLSETMSHYRMRRRGFEETEDNKTARRQAPPAKLFAMSTHRREPRGADVNFIAQGFLHRFQSPTIFLKVSCDGDFLLPIVVGEFAIEKLVDANWGHGNEDSPDQFQFLRNLVEKLGYQVKMVKITERVVSTYFARLLFSKPGNMEILSVDARPSDAINVANRCKAPIYVNKQIVVTDAIRISYGMGRVRDTKSTYDVSLDSAVDGPDFLAQELLLVKNIDLAVKEERYKDAAMWKDKLFQLRKSIHGH